MTDQPIQYRIWAYSPYDRAWGLVPEETENFFPTIAAAAAAIQNIIEDPADAPLYRIVPANKSLWPNDQS
jgi:hypothetical protein